MVENKNWCVYKKLNSFLKIAWNLPLMIWQTILKKLKKQPSTAGAVNDSLFLWEWMLFFFRSMDHILNSCCKQKLIKSKEVKKS